MQSIFILAAMAGGTSCFQGGRTQDRLAPLPATRGLALEPEEEALTTYRVHVGGLLGCVRVLAPVDRLSRWPAGDLWPAGRALAARLSSEPDLVRGRRVLELGTGLGIGGIAAAGAGAARVWLSDYPAQHSHLPSERESRGQNIRAVDALNFRLDDPRALRPVDSPTLGDIDPAAVRLAVASHAAHGFGGCVSGVRVDFARGGWAEAVAAGAGEADIVIAGDVLYSPTSGPALARFFADFLGDRPEGKAYVMNPLAGRHQAASEALVADARAAGIGVARFPFATPQAPRGRGPDMELIRLSAAAS